MLKLQRNYYAEFRIREQDKEGNWSDYTYLTIKYPITLNLDIHLGSYKSANSGMFQFINLNKQTAAALWLDVYNIGKKEIMISLYAGYNNSMPLIFYGRVQNCTSYRAEGSTDWMTEIQAFEGGKLFQYGFINATFTKYTKFEDVLEFMLEDDADTKIGCIAPDIPPLPRNRTFIGQTMDLIGREYGGYETFIDKGKLHILGENDVLDDEMIVVTDKSGLLGTPKRASNFLEVNLIFEPQLKTGQAVSLQSESMPQFNKAYKVIAIHHTGTISDRVSGNLKTELTLSAEGSKPFRKVEQVVPLTYNSKTTNNNTTKWDKPLKTGRLSDKFGMRYHPIKKKQIFHTGIDIAAPLNTPIYAPANGVVAITPLFNGGYGNWVQVNHGKIDNKEVVSSYGHMQSFAVKRGDTVYKGQTIIGYVGSTGVYPDGKKSSTGNHLHFQVTENGKAVDPTKYIGNY